MDISDCIFRLVLCTMRWPFALSLHSKKTTSTKPMMYLISLPLQKPHRANTGLGGEAAQSGDFRGSPLWRGRMGWLCHAVSGDGAVECGREIDIMARHYVKAGVRGGGVARCLHVWDTRGRLVSKRRAIPAMLRNAHYATCRVERFLAGHQSSLDSK